MAFDKNRTDPLFLGNRHEQLARQDAADRALDLVRDIIGGKDVEERVPLPWSEPMFQKAVLHYLRVEAPKLEAAAHKLAIVKEVFGGAKL